MSNEPLWKRMDRSPRTSLSELQASHLPETPGVYALYRGDDRVYVGKAKDLRGRVWRNHSGRGHSLTGSAMRRNVAEELGIASAADIKFGRYRPTDDDVLRVRSWMEECDIAWLTCESESDALALEDGLKREFRPPLTKR